MIHYFAKFLRIDAEFLSHWFTLVGQRKEKGWFTIAGSNQRD